VLDLTPSRVHHFRLLPIDAEKRRNMQDDRCGPAASGLGLKIHLLTLPVMERKF
jgi:hypothetical protein